MKNYKRGFIALFSVIIITSALLLMATTLSFSGFMGRFNILDSELKEKSNALAEACIDEAILRVYENINYTTSNQCISVGDDCPNGKNICEIVSVQQDMILSNKKIIITTKASSGEKRKAYTFYQATLIFSPSDSTLKVISFKELENLS